MARSFGLLIVVALLTGLMACLPRAEQASRQPSEDIRHETARHETTNAIERTSAPTLTGERTTGQDTTAVTEALVSWDYVALGDSLAVGVGAHRGYVARYAANITADTGARIDLANRSTLSIGSPTQWLVIVASRLLIRSRTASTPQRFSASAATE